MGDSYDVIVIGSGAGGGTLVHRLAPSGKRILLLERGDWLPREPQNWLEPGEHVFRADLEGAERAQGVTVADGDILLVRTGHSRRLAELGPWDTPKAKAGLHPTAVTFLADRHVSVLGSDGNSDTAPSTTEGIDFPIHTLTLNAMGVLLLDYLQFEDLAAACEREGRWEFLFVGAPLRVVDGTARLPTRLPSSENRQEPQSASSLSASATAATSELSLYPCSEIRMPPPRELTITPYSAASVAWTADALRVACRKETM